MWRMCNISTSLWRSSAIQKQVPFIGMCSGGYPKDMTQVLQLAQSILTCGLSRNPPRTTLSPPAHV